MNIIILTLFTTFIKNGLVYWNQKISLQYMSTVTSLSVSDRLMILWYNQGSIMTDCIPVSRNLIIQHFIGSSLTHPNEPTSETTMNCSYRMAVPVFSLVIPGLLDIDGNLTI